MEPEASGAGAKDNAPDFGWSVVRPGEEGWASMLLVELFSELHTAHGFEEDHLAKLASLLA
jgi:hypothetical protein